MSKLVLINPPHTGLAGLSSQSQQHHPPMSLAAVAGLTPSDEWEIVIEDGTWGDVKFHPDADLVGCTAFTSQATEAYKCLKPYREAGIQTIMGGIHAWACEIEARRYAGSVLLGEAEQVWWRTLLHAKCGLSPVYQSKGKPYRFASPRFDLLDKRYDWGVVQFSRGCPGHCLFCSVPGFSGNAIRRNPYECIVDDLQRVPQERLFLADDNCYGMCQEEHAWATKTFAMLAAENLGKKFVIQCSMDVSRDDEFLEAAYAAGVRLILIGIEAQDEKALRSVGKRINLENGRMDFSRIHKAGIGVLGAWVIGLDTDTPASLKARAVAMVECGSDCNQLCIATPLPGTPLYRQMEHQGRLLYTNYPEDWAKHDFSRLVYVPAGFRSEAEFYDTASEFAEVAFSDKVLKGMAQRTYDTTKSWETAGWSYSCNQGYAAVTRLRADWWASHRNEVIAGV